MNVEILRYEFEMNSKQYEEFCRLFVANELNIPVEKILSDNIPRAIKPGSEEYKNQIDLYWEVEDSLTRNIVIVNAKWRSSEKDKVDQPDVLLIQQVKNEIAAHKAMIITNTDFTNGAKNAAKNHEIALHIVKPNFEYPTLHTKDRKIMQIQLQESINESKAPYIHEIIHRAFDFELHNAAHTSIPEGKNSHTKEIKQAQMNRRVEQGTNRGTPPNIQKVQTRQQTSQTGGQRGQSSGGQGGARQSKGSGSTRGSGGGRSNRSK